MVVVVIPPFNLAIPVDAVVNEPVTDKLWAFAAVPMKKPPVLFNVVFAPIVDAPEAIV